MSVEQEPRGRPLHTEGDRPPSERLEQAQRLREEFVAAAQGNLTQARTLAERLAEAERRRQLER